MSILKQLLFLFIGSLFVSIGITFFIVPSNIVDGGMIGVALILNYIWDVNIGFILVLLSIPVFILVWFYQSSFVYKSLVGILMTAAFINLLDLLSLELTLHSLPTAILGGLLLGTGVGIMFIYNISSDSLDLFALYLSDILKLNVGILIFIIDALVVGVGFFIISKEEQILSLIAITSHGMSATLITRYRN